MKNTKILLVAMALIFAASCGNKSSNENAKGSDTTKKEEAKRPATPKTDGACSVELSVSQTPPNPAIEEYSVALSNIQNYVTLSPKLPNQYSFALNVDANFKSYVGSADIAFLHFILAQSTAPQQLMIYVSAINSSKGHVYVHGTDGFYYVFKAPLSMVGTTAPDAPLPASTFTPLTAGYSGRILEYNDAASWISDYNTNMAKNKTAYSFTLPASVLNEYLTGATTITRLRFYLGENSGRLALIIIGEDGSNNEVYVNDATTTVPPKYHVLEYCNPCPQCAELTGRNPLQFEAPCSKTKGK
jgi:hypothetical protein